MPKVGAHVSAAVSLELAFEKGQKIGAEAIQFFVSPPQQWFQTKHDDAEIARFVDKQRESGIGPNFIHGTYLVNLGTDNPEHLQKSVDWLIYGLNLARKLEVQGLIFHLGSHKGRGFDTVLPQIVSSLKQVLEKTELTENNHNFPLLILETSAGAGGTIGRDFHELGQIIKAVDNPRLAICMDTQHVFAAGYDIKTLVGLNDVLTEFDEEIGLNNLAAIHANDSKMEYKSGKDRHENIGEGFIGKEGFENMLNHSQLKDVTFLLEVPGFDDNGPDIENVKLLKSMLKKNVS